MKTLQNNFTTPEQSKRLLELGVPADSADCYYNNIGDIFILHHAGVYEDIVTSRNTPCWSVGRLIEIMALCYEFDFPNNGAVQVYATDIKKGIVVDVLISDIERYINKIDFSELEN